MKLDKAKLLASAPDSYWIDSMKDIFPSYPALHEDAKADVIIVGGGIAGITCAYLLSKEGLSVTVLEANRLACGTTGHTTAKITSQHNLIYYKLLKQLGAELAKQYADANQTAILEIKKLTETLNINCDFVSQPAFVYTESEDYINPLHEELNTALNFGIKADYVDSIPFPFTIKGALRFDNQAQFHPLKYSLSLAGAFTENGGKIFEKTRVVELAKDEQYAVITDEGHRVSSDILIIASHYPFYNKAGMYFSRIYQQRSYVAAVRAKEKYPGGMYINAEEPVHSLRSHTTHDGELILLGGAQHKSGQGGNTKKNYEELLDFAEPYFNITGVPYHWSTQDCMTVDGLPYVGNMTSDTPNLYITTGFGKWGMTNSMASAMLLRDLITKGDSPWKDVYNPSRHTKAASALTFAAENFNVAEKLIGGKFQPLTKLENIELVPGEGKVVDLDGKRAGVYMDDEGVRHIVNTTCTHMGCELNWNPAERTWDCPCHGSRFSCTGKVIDSPAVNELSMDEDVNTVGKLLNEDF
ncbi:MAG: FAD-dependent oxidoreductase [Eubacteriales bacterium]|nr:FAD-dependent oxidoreductase [Eubacteriales bacterium]MDD3198777.1 FAD-dependent oxidoreductase [Eubacteriales bacterium]MDD4628977.1 FAD-dependent oxidoreductase [Eubacteriales bacterium]